MILSAPAIAGATFLVVAVECPTIVDAAVAENGLHRFRPNRSYTNLRDGPLGKVSSGRPFTGMRTLVSPASGATRCNRLLIVSTMRAPEINAMLEDGGTGCATTSRTPTAGRLLRLWATPD